MRITFLLPYLELSGMLLATFHYANQLLARGHEVRVIYRAPDSRREAVRALRRALTASPVPWFNLRTPLTRVPEITSTALPSADVTVATDWSTAEKLAACDRRTGAQVFHIHSYDIFDVHAERLEAAWRLPLNRIVVSSWVKQVAQQLSIPVSGPVIYGVDHQQFYGSARAPHDSIRVGMLYHPLPHKGFMDGLAAFKRAKDRCPNLELVVFGGDLPRELAPDAEFHRRPTGERLRRVYASCDIWLVPSRIEGCHMVAMEALACGCALVTTDVGGIRDYALPGSGALVSPPGQPEELARNLITLLENPETLHAIARTGQEKIAEFTWEHSTAELERLLYSFQPQS